MIAFRNVSKSYADGTTAVKDLNLVLEPGTITVFVGPSGCGKTTSLRMINRMIDASEGVVEVNGKNVLETNPTQLRLGIGYVLQDAGLLPHRRVLDNIATVLRLKGVAKPEARQRAQETMSRVGLSEALADRFPSQLSGGQRQRVGVARALAADPPILLMDEPFSAVDPLVRDELQRELLRLQRELHKTIVFVTHDIDEALRLGDRIAVFGPGGILHQHDTPERILAAPASDFVAQFVGRDRGFRSLSFSGFADAPVHQLSGSDTAVSLPGQSDWKLFLDSSGRPTDWVQGSLTRPVTAVVTATDSLRTALDAALESPVRQAPLVDDAGRLTGILLGTDLLGGDPGAGSRMTPDLNTPDSASPVDLPS